MDATRLSLRWKLPGVLALLLVLAVGLFGTFAYGAVRRTVSVAGRERLEHASEQLADILGAQLRAGVQALSKRAADTAFVHALEGPMDRKAVAAALDSAARPSAQVVSTELRDSTGATVATLPGSIHLLGPSIPGLSADAAGVSKLFARGDTAFYAMSAPVRANGRLLGSVVVTRALATTPEQVNRVAGRLGSKASFLLGNADGSVWSDLVHEVPAPPVPATGVPFEWKGETREAGSATIRGTPLMVEVDLPEALLAGPLESVVHGFIGLGILIVLLGVGVGLLLSRGLTKPLTRLTAAAEAISAGTIEAPGLALDRGDEVGRLSRAFGRMTQRVHEAWDDLERQVDERTRELREAQEELVRKERLAILGQLSSGVGHELRNPLGVMNNAVYYLEAVLTDVPDKVGKYLGILRTQIRLSEKIVADLLDFAQTRTPERAPLEVGALVREQLERVSVPASVAVEIDIPERLPPVPVDPVQIGQVLVNLFTNAAQAMEEGGGTLEVGACTEDGMVCIVVRDSGPGVEASNADRIFEPLFTTKARGIGLGLAVSRSLARANGGDLTLEREQGPGATFRVTLPAGDAG